MFFLKNLFQKKEMDDQRIKKIFNKIFLLAENVENEIPVATILTDQTYKIIAIGENETNKTLNPLAHAEMNITKYLRREKKFFLFVNLEPCVMCYHFLKEFDVKIFFIDRNYRFGILNLIDADLIQYDYRSNETIALLKKFYGGENLRIKK